jgi:enterochelin esterase-like enzyme
VHRRQPGLATLLLLLGGCGASSAGPADPQGTTPIAGWEGTLTTYPLTSTVPGIGSRKVTVLVPPGYADAASAVVRYPVLIMHDGQNCLDRDGFGHGGWHVHTTVADLVGRGLMAPAIVVMVDNSGSRAQEYVPGFGAAPGPSAEGYLDFLEADVIPFVERHYRTRAGAASRGIGGSSYGGLISLYAAWTRPATYGFAMAMSTAYAYDVPALVRATATPPALRLYLDSGTRDYSGGDDGMAATAALRDLLVSKGVVLGTDLMHVIGQGDTHDESYWRKRLPGALPFLLPP